MIKSLSNITDISVIDQNGTNDILTFSKIEFEDNAIGAGGFGSVHKVQSIDGISKSEFVLKIFTDEEHKLHAYDVIKLLHQKLKKRQSKSKTPVYHDIPELLGLPFLAFKGYDNISEKHCVAFLIYNLEKLSYEDFGSDITLSDEYKSLSIPNKLYLAYQLSKTINFLHSIEFIHADMSENSIWFNSKRVQLALIDYDSGYHFDSQDKPSTLGKLWQGTTGFFKKVFAGEIEKEKVTTSDRLFEEYFWLAHHVFEIVSGVSPYFFLSDADDNTKQEYLGGFEWPDIDHSSPLFNKANSQQHRAIISFIEQLENAGAAELTSAFKTVFNKGYKNETKRLTSKEWKNLLLNLNQSLENNPLIKNYSSNKTSINKKDEEVAFSFDVQKYNAVYLNNKLVPLYHKSITLPLQDSSKIVLKTINDFEVVEDFIEIKAIKTEPKISLFEASTLLRNTKSPVILSWLVNSAKEILISGLTDSFSNQGNIDVDPVSKTTYTLTAIGFFDEKITKELTIDVIAPVIKAFTWEINLNEGIDNVDLFWETAEAQSVEITPNVTEVSLSGLAHVPINKETVFKLIAEGLFSSIEKEITAHPFPVPIVKQIFADAPKIEINTNIDFSESNLPQELFSANNIQFSNNVHFNNLEINSTELKSSLDFPMFQNENALINKFSKETITLSDIYSSVLEKIHKRLNK